MYGSTELFIFRIRNSIVENVYSQEAKTKREHLMPDPLQIATFPASCPNNLFKVYLATKSKLDQLNRD